MQVVDSLSLEPGLYQNLKDLLESMLQEAPEKRPSAQKLLENNFFNSVSQKTNNSEALNNLLSYRGENNLKYLLQMYASLNMTSSIDKTEYLTEFYNLDTNRDGQIQLTELISGIMNTFGVAEAEARQKAEEMFRQLDKNQSGSLNFS